MNSAKNADLAVVNGRVFLPGSGLVSADLWVWEGRFSRITSPHTSVQTTETIDVDGQVVLPGAIDGHVHLGANITVARSSEEVVGETSSALAGGPTTVLAYLMSPETYEDLFAEAKEVMDRYSACEYGFHFIIGIGHQLDHLGDYVQDLGVSSFKFFMNYKADEEKYLNLPGNDHGCLWQLLRRSSEIGAMVNPHAANIELVWNLRDEACKAGGPDLVAWNKLCPPIVEAEAEAWVGMLAEATDASVYAVHCSSKLALDALRARRATHDGVFIETCPHYLILDQSLAIGTYGKVNPPLRIAVDREALCAALADRVIDVVGADHVPRHKSAKEGDIRPASAGFPGVDTLLPLLLSEGHVKRGIPLARIVNAVSALPAQLLGLAPRKGMIAVGSDADMAIVDFRAAMRFKADQMNSTAAYTPYERIEAAVAITHTILGGRLVAQNGTVSNDPHGRYLHRHTSGRAALARDEQVAGGVR